MWTLTLANERRSLSAGNRELHTYRGGRARSRPQREKGTRASTKRLSPLAPHLCGEDGSQRVFSHIRDETMTFLVVVTPASEGEENQRIAVRAKCRMQIDEWKTQVVYNRENTRTRSALGGIVRMLTVHRNESGSCVTFKSGE